MVNQSFGSESRLDPDSESGSWIRIQGQEKEENEEKIFTGTFRINFFKFLNLTFFLQLIPTQHTYVFFPVLQRRIILMRLWLLVKILMQLRL
jgi:hypothetical protein